MLFDRWRPRDINLEVAVSGESGNLTFYTEGGLSSVFNTTSLEQARKYHEAGSIKHLKELKVPCLPLSTILQRHLLDGQKLSFFSIDAEGNDITVLRSNDWNQYRPELVLAETHTSSLEKLIADELVELMRKNEYHVRSWIAPTLIFARNEQQ